MSRLARHTPDRPDEWAAPPVAFHWPQEFRPGPARAATAQEIAKLREKSEPVPARVEAFQHAVTRCWCGRSVSWDGVFCAEHDDGPPPDVTVEVPLSQGLVAVIDATDAPAVFAAGKWSAKREGPNVYACRTMDRPDGSRGLVRLHTFLTGWQYVDHRDGDGLNNTRSNLRPADAVTNGRNRRPGKNNKSGYVGVCWNAQHGHWRAYIYDRGRNVYLGAFGDPAQAARVRDAAAVELFGEYARLNFPREHDDGPPPTPEPIDRSNQ